MKKSAIKIFEKTHNINFFNNNGSKIYVYYSGIRECIEKIYNNYAQRKLLYIHLLIIENLEKILENAIIINQVKENKGRKKYIIWNYYYISIKYKKDIYSVIIDVVITENNEMQYRLQRIELKKTDNHDGDL